MIPPTIFFFVALHIVALVRSLMVKATTAQELVRTIGRNKAIRMFLGPLPMPSM